MSIQQYRCGPVLRRLRRAGRIHGVAPDIVGKFVFADDAGDNGPGIDSDPHLPGWQAQLLPLPVEPGQVVKYSQRAQ